MPAAYVYMLRCQNGALYTGWTDDLPRRLAAHQSGKGAKYTRGFGVQGLAWAERLPGRSAAMEREAALKKLPKAEKEALAAAFRPERLVLLRPAKPQDAAAVLRVFGHYVRHSTASFLYQTPTEAAYQKQIRQISRTLPYLIAENAKGDILGYACAHPWRYGCDAYAWDAETTIYLAPAARRQGVGGMLYHALLGALARQGYWNAYAVLADPNPESEAFHTRFGFVCEGRQARSGYKNGWQGVSYWLLDLAPAACAQPAHTPRPLACAELKEILAAASAGQSWQSIAGRQPAVKE